MPNRLSEQSSPYLLQHAENPVDWYPWGEEALARARTEDKPILLSIGYSACHWCHVMERESFEDSETASAMNAGFVNIKVDREERPDLDAIYMRALQASTGRGGWPLTAFLTPDGRFFYGGTYFPPEPRHGMPSFRQVLAAVLDAYENRRGEVEEGSTKLLKALRNQTPPADWMQEAGVEVSPDEERADDALGGSHPTTRALEDRLAREAPSAMDRAFRFLSGQFDTVHGGFGQAPKFPQSTTLEFLLNQFHRTREEGALSMVVTTLRAMSRGGMRDHLGGGFHRYSVDSRWLVPHFEKMLYDNGLLARAYLQAYLVTGETEFRDVATSTLDYLLADLRHPDGGFFSARDADSDGEEGTFYLWTLEEIRGLLAPPESELFRNAYGVTEEGNFEGKNILHVSVPPSELAGDEGLTMGELETRLENARKTLLESRSQRNAPFRDEKVLVGWNGFALRALAEAGAALGRSDYLDAAAETGHFLLGAVRRDQRILRSWKDGKSRIPGFLEDYASLGNALLSLYEATLEPRWLREAKVLGDRILDLFWEEDEGILYDSPRDGEDLVYRPREVMDNAIPSGNSLAIELLLRLGSVFGAEEFRHVGLRLLNLELDAAARLPTAFGRFLSLLGRAVEPPVEIVVLGKPDDPVTRNLLTTAHAVHLPARVVAGGMVEELPHLPLLEGRTAREGRTTVYVCRDFTCSAPLHEITELERELGPAVHRRGGENPLIDL